MKTIQFYLLKEYLKFLLGSLILFLGMYVIIKLTEQLKNILKTTSFLPMDYVMYFVYEFPLMLTYLFPAASLFSIVYILGRFNTQNELIAYYNSKMSIVRAAIPIVIFTAIVSSLFFYYEDFIYRCHQGHLGLHEKLNNRSQQEQPDREYLTLFGSNNKLYLIKLYSPSSNTMFNANILYLSPEGKKFKKLISAETIRYDYVKKVWHASNVFVRNWKNDEMQTTLSPSLTLDLEESIFHFQEAKHANVHLSSTEIRNIARITEVTGGNYNYYYTEYYLKMAVPYIPVIILFFGIPVATFSRRMNMALSLLVVVIIAFCFFILSYVGGSLGKEGYLPPILGGWLGNIVFGILAFWVIKKGKV